MKGALPPLQPCVVIKGAVEQNGIMQRKKITLPL
jgi:hypothetical protein